MAKRKKIVLKPTQTAIARVAFRLFEQRGSTHGDDRKDWMEAERRLLAAAMNRRPRRTLKTN